ncbi:hypothetical protein R1flu_010202 [Riccia fluitans]|uniref:Uncharacterized protein n=1 Tax=Riccia fluitans TaxID=41844 RepID=A0ABD1Z4B5_9MARC
MDDATRSSKRGMVIRFWHGASVTPSSHGRSPPPYRHPIVYAFCTRGSLGRHKEHPAQQNQAMTSQYGSTVVLFEPLFIWLATGVQNVMTVSGIAKGNVTLKLSVSPAVHLFQCQIRDKLIVVNGLDFCGPRRIDSTLASYHYQFFSPDLVRGDTEDLFAAMDGIAESSVVRREQEMALAFLPYECNLQPAAIRFQASLEETKRRKGTTAETHELGNIQSLAVRIETQNEGTRKRKIAVAATGQPLDMRFDPPAEGKKKSKPATAESGQRKSRWTAHNKATCMCGVCKQTRGELRGTWFNHDKLNCKCSVCKQARGERGQKKASVKAVPAKQKVKPPSVSKGRGRPAGKLSAQGSSVLAAPAPVLSSGVLTSSDWINRPSDEARMRTLNGILASPVNWTYRDGAGINLMSAAMSFGRESGPPYQKMTTNLDTSIEEEPSSLGVSPQAEVRGVNISPNWTSSAKSIQLPSDEIMLSWKHKFSRAISTPERLSQPLWHPFASQVQFCPADFTAQPNSSFNASLRVDRCESLTQPPSHILHSQSLCSPADVTTHSYTSHFSQPPLPAVDSQSLCRSADITAQSNAAESDCLAENRCESLAQPPSHALASPELWSWANLRALSKTGHSTYKDSEINSSSSSHSLVQASVVPSCPSEFSGTTLSSIVSKSKITGDLTQDIRNMERIRNSAVLTVVPGGAHIASEEAVKGASSQNAGVWGSQVDSEGTTSGGNCDLSVAGEKEALPCVADMHLLESTSTDKAVDLALPLVSTILPIASQETSSPNSKKRNRTCSCNSYTCECDGCVDGGLSGPSRITFREYTTSALKRRRIFSHSMDIKRPLRGTLHSIDDTVSSESLRSFKIKKLTAKVVTRPLRLEDGAYGSCSAATIRDLACYCSGSCLRLGAWNQNQNSSQLQIRTSSRWGQKSLFSTQTSSISAASRLMFFLTKGRRQSRGTMELLMTNSYRILLRSMEQEVSVSPADLRVESIGPSTGRSPFDSGGHRRYPLQSELNPIEISSQKAADIRIHRSQSALLLGQQPCSLLIVAHLQPALECTPYRVPRGSGFAVNRRCQNVRLFTCPRDFGSLGSLCYNLEGWMISLQIYFHKSGNTRPVFDLKRLVTLLQRSEGVEQILQKQLLRPICAVGFGAACSSPDASRRGRVGSSWPGAPSVNSALSIFDVNLLVTLLQRYEGVEETFQGQLHSPVCTVGSGGSCSSLLARIRKIVSSSWPVTADINSGFSVSGVNTLVKLLQKSQGVGQIFQRQWLSPTYAVGSGASCSSPPARRKESVTLSWLGAEVNSDLPVFDVNTLATLLQRNQGVEETFQRQLFSPVWAVGWHYFFSSSWPGVAVFDVKGLMTLLQRNQGDNQVFQKQFLSPTCTIDSGAECSFPVARRRMRVSMSWLSSAEVDSDYSVFDVKGLVTMLQRKQGVEQIFQRQMLSPVCAIGSGAECSSLVARRRERFSSSWLGAAEVTLDISAAIKVMPTEVPKLHRLLERFTPWVQSVFVLEQRSRDKRKYGNLGFVEPLVKQRRLSCSRSDFSAAAAAVCRWTHGMSDPGSAPAIGGPSGYVGLLRSVSRTASLLPSNGGVDTPGDNEETWFTGAPRSDDNFSGHLEDADTEKIYLQTSTHEYPALTQKSGLLRQIKAEVQTSDGVRTKAEIHESRTEGTSLPSLCFQELLCYASKVFTVKSVMTLSRVEFAVAQTSKTKGRSGELSTPEDLVTVALLHKQAVPRMLIDPLRPVTSDRLCSFEPADGIMECVSYSCQRAIEENPEFLGDRRILSTGAGLPCKVESSNAVVAMQRDRKIQEHRKLARLKFYEAGELFPSFLRSPICPLSFGASVRLLSAQRESVTASGGPSAAVERALVIFGGTRIMYSKRPQLPREEKCTALRQHLISMQHEFKLKKKYGDVDGQPAVSMQQGLQNKKRGAEVVAQPPKKQKFTALLQQPTSMQERSGNKEKEEGVEAQPLHQQDEDVEAHLPRVQKFNVLQQQQFISMQRRSGKRKDEDEEAHPLREQKFNVLQQQQLISMQDRSRNKKNDEDIEVHPRREEKFTSLLQHFIHMQQELGNKKIGADLDFDGAAESFSEQRGLSKSGTALSAIFSTAHQWTPETHGVGSSPIQGVVGSSEPGELQLSVSNSREKLLTCDRSTPSKHSGRDDARFLLIGSQSLEDSMCREREDVNRENKHPWSNTSEYSTVSESSDPGCDLRGKRLVWDGVRRTVGIQQTQTDVAEETARGDQRSALSPGLSFKDLLSSVSLSFAEPSGGSISVELSSAQGSSHVNRKCGGCIQSELQELQTVTTKINIVCFPTNDLQISDPSCEQLKNISLNRGTSSDKDKDENKNEGSCMAGETSCSGDDTPYSCRSKGMENTRSRFSDAYSSTGKRYATRLAWELEERVLSEVVNLLPEIPGPSAREILSDESSVLGPNASSFPLELSSEHDILTTLDEERDCDEVEVLQTSLNFMHEKTEFEQKLKAAVEKPFSMQQLKELQRCVSERKPQMRLRESRHETRHVPLEKDGLSYLEHYPDFRRKLESADRPREKLKLLRGFFFWIQHTCMSGAFMPWEEEEEEDDDCIQIVEEKCTPSRRASSDKSKQIKAVSGGSCRGDAVTKGSTHQSSLHMSLRARKKVVYMSESRVMKKTAGHVGTTKVKTEHKTRKLLIPWEEEEEADCTHIAKEKCTTPRRGASNKPNHIKAGMLGDAVTKESTHESSLRLSLRARKEVLHTSNIRKGERAKEHRGTTKVNTGDKTLEPDTPREEEEDEDSAHIEKEKCTTRRRTTADKPNQIKAVKGGSWLGNAVTKESTHEPGLNMSLRARKDVVYMSKTRRGERVEEDRGTTKMKTDGKTLKLDIPWEEEEDEGSAQNAKKMCIRLRSATDGEDRRFTEEKSAESTATEKRRTGSSSEKK